MSAETLSVLCPFSFYRDLRGRGSWYREQNRVPGIVATSRSLTSGKACMKYGRAVFGYLCTPESEVGDHVSLGSLIANAYLAINPPFRVPE
jgi:hypothetical protein